MAQNIIFNIFNSHPMVLNDSATIWIRGSCERALTRVTLKETWLTQGSLKPQKAQSTPLLQQLALACLCELTGVRGAINILLQGKGEHTFCMMTASR